MSLDEDKKYLLEHVFNKIQYDRMLEKYVIRLSTYLPLTLSSQRQQLLEEMCQENNIELAKLPVKLTIKETEELFIEYDRLKKEISLSSNPNQTTELKEQAIKIRNKIVEGHLELVYKYIATIVPNIEDLNEKDDMYQSGYEILIHMIEIYNPNKGINFMNYLYLYGFKNIKRKVKDISENDISNKDLQFLSSISLDACIESLEEKQNNSELEYQEDIKDYLQYEPYFVDDSLESQIKTIIFKELISKIVDTLTIQQSTTLKMYYGLNNQPNYNQKEIAEILETKPQCISDSKETGIRHLKLPIYLKYLQEIIENYTDSVYRQEEKPMPKGSKKANERKISQLEKFLLQYLPKETLIEQLRRNYGINPNLITKEELFNYLMYNYLNKSKPKTKQKRK